MPAASVPATQVAPPVLAAAAAQAEPSVPGVKAAPPVPGAAAAQAASPVPAARHLALTGAVPRGACVCVCVWPRCSATAEAREGGGGGGERASRDHWKGREVRESGE